MTVTTTDPAWLAEPEGWVLTSEGDRIPSHIMQAGSHILAEALDVATLVYGVAQRFHALDAALIGLVRDESANGGRLFAAMDASYSLAISEVFETMAQYAHRDRNAVPSPEEIREKFRPFAALPYGPASTTVEVES